MSGPARVADRWHSPRLGREVGVVRWGNEGTPVIFFPTAAGDAEEVERFLMVDALAPLLEAGRIKLYSVDSVPGQVWLTEDNRAPMAIQIQNAFDGFVVEELVPAIATDGGGEEVEVIVTGASIGAYNALAAICRHPELFSHAICLSGTYELSKFVDGEMDEGWYSASPLHFVPDLAEDHKDLQRLRERFVLLAHGGAAGRARRSPGALPPAWVPAASPTGSTSGEPSGTMIGRPGVGCCPNTSTSCCRAESRGLGTPDGRWEE